MPITPAPAPRAHLRGASVLALVAALAGCGGAGDKDPEVGKSTPKPVATASPRGAAEPELLPSTVLGRIDEDASPWHFARGKTGGLAVFAAKGRWWTVRVSDGGSVSSAVVDAAPAPTSSLSGLVASGDGWLCWWVEPDSRMRNIKVMDIDSQGKARAAPVLMASPTDEVSWVEVLPNARGALVLWEVPRGDRVDVWAVPLAGNGKVPGSPAPLVKGALAWRAVSAERGAGVAVITAPAPATKPDRSVVPRNALGRVELVETDPTGKASPPVVVQAEATAHPDVDLVPRAGGWLLAWTDQREMDASVQVAQVTAGKVTMPPRRATPPAGDQAFIALVPARDGKRTLIAWEEMLQPSSAGRTVRLGLLDEAGKLGNERAEMVFASSGRPDLSADGDGFAALTLAPAKRGAGPFTGAEPLWPTYLRFARDLSLRTAEPVRAAAFSGTEAVPAQTRYLSCGMTADTCTLLATGAGAGAPLALVRLPMRKSPWAAPAGGQASEGPPRATAVNALFDGEQVSDLAVGSAPDGSGQLVAWVTYFLEGARTEPKPKGEPAFAALGVRPLAGGTAGAATTISRRALSIGGVSVAVSPRGKHEALVGWVARERNDPQVFVTRVGADGAKLAQKMLTVVARPARAGFPNEVSDVAVAWAGNEERDEWVVSWVDTRDGNPEVYAARVDKDLKKTIPDKRITEAAGEASDVQLRVVGKETWLAFSDTRSDVEAGNADVWLARLETASLKELAEETRVFASPGNSRSPRFAAGGTRVLGWIEEEARKSGTALTAAQGALLVVELDDKGAASTSPVSARGPRGAQITAAALACAAAEGKPRPLCRAALTSASGDAADLSGAEIDLAGGAAPPAARSLAVLSGGAGIDAVPAFGDGAGQHLFFADDVTVASSGAHADVGSGRIRWMNVAWR
ncbi:MAG: hypothetical protein WKG00_22925 [Polyangiaceae bacterium]